MNDKMGQNIDYLRNIQASMDCPRKYSFILSQSNIFGFIILKTTVNKNNMLVPSWMQKDNKPLIGPYI